MANEQIVAELQALKAEPGFQMHWQERVQHVIDALTIPPASPPPPPLPDVVLPPPLTPPPPVETAKSKTTTAAHVTPAKTKGK